MDDFHFNEIWYQMQSKGNSQEVPTQRSDSRSEDSSPDNFFNKLLPHFPVEVAPAYPRTNIMPPDDFRISALQDDWIYSNSNYNEEYLLQTEEETMLNTVNHQNHMDESYGFDINSIFGNETNQLQWNYDDGKSKSSTSGQNQDTHDNYTSAYSPDAYKKVSATVEIPAVHEMNEAELNLEPSHTLTAEDYEIINHVGLVEDVISSEICYDISSELCFLTDSCDFSILSPNNESNEYEQGQPLQIQRHEVHNNDANGRLDTSILATNIDEHELSAIFDSSAFPCDVKEDKVNESSKIPNCQSISKMLQGSIPTKITYQKENYNKAVTTSELHQMAMLLHPYDTKSSFVHRNGQQTEFQKKQIKSWLRLFKSENIGPICFICLALFWYRSSLYEHLRDAHGIEKPKEYLSKIKDTSTFSSCILRKGESKLLARRYNVKPLKCLAKSGKFEWLYPQTPRSGDMIKTLSEKQPKVMLGVAKDKEGRNEMQRKRQEFVNAEITLSHKNCQEENPNCAIPYLVDVTKTNVSPREEHLYHNIETQDNTQKISESAKEIIDDSISAGVVYESEICNYDSTLESNDPKMECQLRTVYPQCINDRTTSSKSPDSNVWKSVGSNIKGNKNNTKSGCKTLSEPVVISFARPKRTRTLASKNEIKIDAEGKTSDSCAFANDRDIDQKFDSLLNSNPLSKRLDIRRPFPDEQNNTKLCKETSASCRIDYAGMNNPSKYPRLLESDYIRLLDDHKKISKITTRKTTCTVSVTSTTTHFKQSPEKDTQQRSEMSLLNLYNRRSSVEIKNEEKLDLEEIAIVEEIKKQEEVEILELEEEVQIVRKDAEVEIMDEIENKSTLHLLKAREGNKGDSSVNQCCSSSKIADDENDLHKEPFDNLRETRSANSNRLSNETQSIGKVHPGNEMTPKSDNGTQSTNSAICHKDGNKNVSYSSDLKIVECWKCAPIVTGVGRDYNIMSIEELRSHMAFYHKRASRTIRYKCSKCQYETLLVDEIVTHAATTHPTIT